MAKDEEQLSLGTAGQGPQHSLVKCFTASRYASVVYAMALCLSVWLSVSVTSQSSTKMAKRRMTQITLHDNPGNLVF